MNNSHSPEAAKKMWCPMVRVLNFQAAPDHNYPINRPTGDFNCIATDCMMWHWDDPATGHCGLTK